MLRRFWMIFKCVFWNTFFYVQTVWLRSIHVNKAMHYFFKAKMAAQLPKTKRVIVCCSKYKKIQSIIYISPGKHYIYDLHGGIKQINTKHKKMLCHSSKIFYIVISMS